MTENANAAGAAQSGATSGGAAAASAQAQAGSPSQGAQAAAANAGGDTPFYAPLNPSKEAAEFAGIKGWKSFDDVTRDYRALEGKISAKGTLVPAADAPPEEWAKFYAALPEYPADPTKYNVPIAAGITPTEFEKALETKLRPAFHKAGLTQRQVKILTEEGYIPFATEQMKAQKDAEAAKAAEDERSRDEFMKTLGGDKPVSDKERLEFVALGQRAVQDLIPDAKLRAEILSAVNEKTGTPAFLKIFGEIGRKFYREGSGALNPGAQPGAMTGAQAQHELNQMKADPNVRKILADLRHPQYKATLQKWNDLIDAVGREEDKARPQAA